MDDQAGTRELKVDWYLTDDCATLLRIVEVDIDGSTVLVEDCRTLALTCANVDKLDNWRAFKPDGTVTDGA